MEGDFKCMGTLTKVGVDEAGNEKIGRTKRKITPLYDKMAWGVQ